VGASRVCAVDLKSFDDKPSITTASSFSVTFHMKAGFHTSDRCCQTALHVGSRSVPDKRGGLKGSMQHWPGVYSPEFQSPTFFWDVD
jgi:hypothetical protein